MHGKKGLDVRLPKTLLRHTMKIENWEVFLLESYEIEGGMVIGICFKRIVKRVKRNIGHSLPPLFFVQE